MKLFISSDIEGTCGITAWEETYQEKSVYWSAYFQEQMTKEVAAACEGAFSAGFAEVLIKDAHDTARNIIPKLLPKGAELIRGWGSDGWSMMEGLQHGADAVAFTGYHAAAGCQGSPLAHSFSTTVDTLTINGERASEFTVNSYTAGFLGVPVVFISGDAAVCRQAKTMIPNITAVPVLDGKDNSTTSGHPDLAVSAIREGMKQALAGDWRRCQVAMPKDFTVTVRYTTHSKAAFAAVYPGVKRLDSRTVDFSTEDYREVLRFMHFCV